MTIKKYLQIMGYGILIWLVPFIISIFFYSRDGQLLIELMLFKTLMLLIGGLTGALCICRYFKNCQSDFLKEGLIIGSIWLIIQWILDYIILIPMSKITLSNYTIAIGLRYCIIPIMSIMAGYILTTHFKK